MREVKFLLRILMGALGLLIPCIMSFELPSGLKLINSLQAMSCKVLESPSTACKTSTLIPTGPTPPPHHTPLRKTSPRCSPPRSSIPALTPPSNPPGLAQPKISPLLNLRPTTRPPLLDIPHNLTTGCYAVGVEELHGAPAPKGTPCHDRVLHVSLSKDKGLIDKKTGMTSDPGTPRGKRADNFQRAVRLAVEDTRRQWSDFRAELKEKYGEKRGERMICVVTRDEPWKEC